ncbi:MAG: FtsX-like permease family protein [Actinomycetota bacterium]|nr:FtsX-like permease family protein [Actinomycetota bacterium]
MLRTAVKGVFANKVRLTLTALAIVIGVAFVAASFVFTDSINTRFEALLDTTTAGVDVYVRPAPPDTGNTRNMGGTFQNGEVGSIPKDTLDSVMATPGVRIAEGGVAGFAQLVNKDGEAIGGQGPPTLGYSWITEPSMKSVTIKEGNGRAPEAAGEVLIDANSANLHDLRIGDTITVLTIGAPEEFDIVGIGTFGESDSLAGATLAIFELREAQRLFDLQGQFSEILVAAESGVTPDELAASISATMNGDIEAVTADAANQDQLDAISEGLGFLNIALLAFAAVAVFVGAFIISNTFRIIVAQRTKELALLRAVGATGRQVTWMVVIEALIVGFVASVIGIGVGILLAIGLAAAMNAFGFNMPEGPLTLLPRTVFVGMAVGLIVTVVSALLPARKAARIPPVAAMREELARPKRRSLHVRAVAGAVTVGLGIAALLVGLFTSVSGGIWFVAIGALVFFLGVSIIAPLAAGPVATVLGWPLPKMFGVAGQLAQDNTRRQPRRTASTASALMIGVALVVFVAVFGASIKASIASSVTDTFPGDFSVQSTNFAVGVSPTFTEEVQSLSEIGNVSTLKIGNATVEGESTTIVAVDPETITTVTSFDVSEGAFESLQETNGILVAESVMDENDWSVGDSVTIVYPQAAGGPIEIAGTIASANFGNYVITEAAYAVGFNNPTDFYVFANRAEGVAIEDARVAIDSVAAGYPNVKVQNKSELISDAESQIDQMLVLFTGLLFLAIIIAVLGITNTLALAIIERTREIGLLRAVGMVRRQVRRMIRWEAVIIALFGAVMGVGVGLFLGWAVVRALADEGLGSFAIPLSQIAVLVLLAAVAGVIAAIYPSWKASRLNVLDAIAYE